MYAVLQELYAEGFTDVYYVCGSDRADEAERIKNYNGKPDKKGNLLYKFNSINIVKAGNDRINEDDIQLEIVSASMQRKFVAENDLESFKMYCPEALDEDQRTELFYDVRKGMGLDEELEEATMKNSENNNDVPKHNYKYYDFIINNYFGDGAKLGAQGKDGLLKASDKYDKSEFEELRQILNDIKTLSPKEFAIRFKEITGVPITKLFKDHPDGSYSKSLGGKGLEAEEEARDNVVTKNDIINRVKPYLEDKFGLITDIELVNTYHIGGKNNRRYLPFPEAFNTEKLYDGVMSGPSTSDKIADLIYYVDIKTNNGIINNYPLYLSIKNGSTTSPINSSIADWDIDTLINLLTNGISNNEYALLNKVFNLRGKSTNVGVSSNGLSEWFYVMNQDKINEQSLKNALVNSYGNNYYYVHLSNGKIDLFKDVAEITEDLNNQQVSEASIIITQARVVCQFKLGDERCTLFFRRKGNPAMFILSEVKHGKKLTTFKGERISDIDIDSIKYIAYK